MAVFDNLISELGKKLDVYEVILSKQKYTAGNVSNPSVDNGFKMVTCIRLGIYPRGHLPPLIRCKTRRSWKPNPLRPVEAQRGKVRFVFLL